MHTGTPISGASVYYRGTHTGCATNNEGMFMLRTALDRERTLVVSAVGYKTQHYRIKPGQYVGIAIELEEKTALLEDVIVLPGRNPALPLMERVRQRRSANDPSQNDNLSYVLNEHNELYISGINRRHLQRRLWKSLQNGMLLSQDSTYLIPLCFTNQPLRFHHNHVQPLAPVSQRTALLTPTDYSVLLNSIEHPLNFYRNNITIFNQSFLSPLANSGNRYYRYYLTDSILTAEGKHYTLRFQTKNPFFASFNGTMQIDSATCALRAIRLTVPRETSVNYLSSLQISQTYNTDNAPLDEHLSLILDFAVKTDTSHIFPTVLLCRSLTREDTIVSTPYARTSFAHPTTLTDSNIVSTMDSLERMPIVRIVKFAAEVINTGYIPTGTPVDIGNITDIIRINPHEYVHLGLPLRTNERLWRNVSIGGYVAYGFHDQAWKGMGEVRIKLPAEKRHIFNLRYEDNYVWSEVSELDRVLRENSIGPGTMTFTTALLNNFYTTPYAVNSATRRREAHLSTENEWNDCLETFFHLRTGRMGYGIPSVEYSNIPSYRYTSLSALFRLSWGESHTDLYFRRIHRHSRYPILFLQTEAGAYRTIGMPQDNLYARLGISLQHQLTLGLWGELDYAFQAGIIFGAVPYPMLQLFNGNQTYAFDPYRFTLMNQYQYAADRYLLLHASWNLNGILFNRIPGLRYLRLRELIEFKIAYGTYSNRHNEVLPLPTYTQPMHVPYVETGIGIGNIFRVADLWSVWRLTNRHDMTTPLWAIRFRLHISQ